MGKQDALFLLIKSLSSGEKAIIRQSVRSQAAYISIFDIMARQKSFDERKLRKKLKQQGIDANYSYAKNYLSRHILKCLRENRDSSGTGLDRAVTEIEILMERKIFSLAEKMTAKARKKALEEERWEAFLKLTQFEMAQLLQGGGRVEQNLETIRTLNEERKAAREKQSNLGEYEDLYYVYRPVLKRKQSARNFLDLELLEDFRKHGLLSGPKAAGSVRALRMYHRCKLLIELYAGEYQQAAKTLEKALDHYRQHKFLMDDFPVDYINALLTQGGMQLHFGNYDEVEKLLDEIRKAQKDRAVHGSELFDKYYRLQVAYAVERRKPGIVEPHLDEIRSGISLFRDSLPWSSLSMLFFMLGRLRFEQGHFDDARNWLNEILDQPNRGIREDLTSMSRIMMIFIYYESGEPDLVESSSRATRKYLRRRDQLHRFEARILSFLEHHSFKATNSDNLSSLRELHADLQTIFEDRLEAAILRYFDILSWLEKKIETLG